MKKPAESPGCNEISNPGRWLAREQAGHLLGITGNTIRDGCFASR
jgi:hypothetical protein